MVNRLEIESDERGAVHFVVDSRRLEESAKEPTWCPLVGTDATLVARFLQGWAPQHLGLERAESMADGEPIPLGGGWVSQPMRDVTRVLVQLPGGSHPEVDAQEANWFAERGVPVLACDCGSGVGCGAVRVDVTFTRDQVRWDSCDEHSEFHFAFARWQYDQEIRTLLELIEEIPVLIDDDPMSWQRAPRTRVVAA